MQEFTRRTLVQGGTALAAAGALTGPALFDFAKAWAQITPLRRIGTAEDIAAAVEFLLSEKASFISGQTLWVDGAVFTQPRWATSDATE